MLQCKTKWKKKKLGNLGYTYSGLSNKTIDDFGSGEDFIPYMNIYKNPIIKTDKFKQVKIGLNERQNQVQSGDVFFTTSSETPDEVGLTSVLVDKIDRPLYLNSFCFGFRLNDSSEFDNKFLAYLLRGENIRLQISKMAQGSTRYNLSKTQLLEKLNLYYPKDKEKQSKIADILLSCDKVIEKTEETIEKYEQIKAGMMQNLFTRGLDENGKLRPKYEQTPDLYKYSQKLDRYIPKEWDIKPMDLVVKRIGDIDHYMPKSVDDGIPYIMTGDFIGSNDLDFKNAKKISLLDYETLSRKIKPEFNDIIIARYATVGTIRIIKTNKPFLVSYSCAIIKTDKTLLNPDYLAYYIKSDFCQNLIDLEINASTQKNIGIDTLKTISIFVPKHNEEQKNIVNAVNSIEQKIEKEKQYLNKYKQIKQGLMKRLLTPPADAEIVEE